MALNQPSADATNCQLFLQCGFTFKSHSSQLFVFICYFDSGMRCALS